MKQSVLILACFFLINASAQKFKVKNGIIFKDKVEIGLVEGKVGILKWDSLHFYSKDKTPILSLEEKNWSIKNPFYDGRYWFEIKFNDSGKQFLMKMTGNCMNEKCILKLLAAQGLDFTGTLFSDQDGLIQKINYEDELVSDTNGIRSDILKRTELLNDNEILRDKSTPIKTMYSSGGGGGTGTTTVTHFKISQDNEVVGRIEKTVKQSTSSIETDYVVFEKFYAPQGENGEKEYERCAYVARSGPSQISVFTCVDQAYHDVKAEDPSKAEKVISAWLIKNGYL